ncbi:AsmA family protein [Rhizobium halophilum]|uniref:AsmA family protein n=1 Tax=Rhizobium halophilum TaxID=2846852 RepID=UPI001EFD0AAD|nr:AsmA family protein [Rhizobium halophilum]MCF6368269.1 AsmA family protein [Rhizobium halophilum]
MLGRILLTVGGLLVVALFAALLAPFIVDWSDFRVEFEQRASRILGKKVTVHGEVEARILPFPSVTLHDVRVGQDQDGQPQLSAEQFSMDMELAPFLSGEARIFDMRIDQPKARVRILEDGTLDWMRGSRADIPLRTVVIEDVHITGGSIELIDEQSGQTRQLEGLNADLSAGSLAGPWRGEGYASLDGEEASFTLSTGEADRTEQSVPLRLRLLPDAAPIALTLDGDLALSEDRPAYDGRFALDFLQEEDETEPTEAPPPRPRLRGNFELTNERIRVPEYRLEVGPLNDPYVVTGEATLDTGEQPEFLLTADGQQIDVNRLGKGERAKTGRDAAASAQRRIQAFVDIATQIPIPQVPGRASFRLPAVVANDTTVRDIQIDVRPAGAGWTVENFAATLPGRTQVEAKGALALEDRISFVGDMLLASNQPSGLADWLSGSVDPAIRQLRSAGFSARVNLTPELQRFDDLELAIGPATLRGRVERHAPIEATPSLTLDLAGNEIDLDAMRALASLITGNDAGADVLDHKVAASLKAERFTAFGIAADDVDTVFTLSEGELSLERLSVGDVAGAAITASGNLSGSLLAYEGTGSATFRAPDPAPFLAMLRNQLSRHPLIDRLAESARWYSDTELSADITVGGDIAGAAAQITGTSNGSAVSAELAMPTLFDVTAGTDFSLSMQLQNEQASVLLGQAGLEPLPLGEDGSGRLSLDVRQEDDAPATVALGYDTNTTHLDLNGSFDLAAENFATGAGRVILRSQDLEPYLLMTGFGLPQFGTGLPVELAANLAITPEAVRVGELAGEVGGNTVASDALVIDRTTSVTTLVGDLSLDTLDLAWLGEAAYGTLADPTTGALSDKPFSLPIFGTAEARLQVQANTFRPGAVGDVTDFTGTIAHRNGGISIDDATGSWKGGRISGRLAMSNGEGTGMFQTRLAVENADLASVVWQAGDAPVATGRVNATISAEATAQSPAQLMASLNGSGELQLSDLVVQGIEPSALPAVLAQVDQIEGELTEEKVRPVVEQFVRTGEARLGSVTVPFTITEGEVRAQNVAAAAGETGLAGEVRIDLLDGVLRGELAVIYAPGDEGLAGGEPAVRLTYSGNVSDPAVQMTVAPLTNFLSLRAFERERRRVEALQASVLEKQRLRREVALYRYQAAEREAARLRAEAEEQARREEEARRQAEAAARAEQERAAAAARAAEEQRRREEQQRALELSVPPTQDVFRQDLPPLTTPSIQNLPGVQP